MCRHIYDWNIVKCDVKQPYSLTHSYSRRKVSIPSVCFRAYRKASEAFSTSLQTLTRFQRNFTWNKISMSSTKFVFFSVRLLNPGGLLGVWLAEKLLTSLQHAAEQNSKKLDRKQYLNFLYQIRSSCGVVVKLLAWGARGPGFDFRSHRYNFWDWLSPASKSRYGWNTAKAT